MRKSGQAFTLVELLTVIAIIGILAALLLPAVSAVKESGRRARARAEVYQLDAAWKSYYDDYRTFPAGAPGDNGGQMVSAVVRILNGENAPPSPLRDRKIRYMEFTKDQVDYGFGSPWWNKDDPDRNKQLYWVALDKNGDNQVDNPYSGFSGQPAKLDRIVAVWTCGKNGKLDAPGSAGDDDIRSWWR
ncbi:MAG: type II secretion system GspH family protein [Kiritimatiellae bacterium]|nr:type II secretion system GspH family protein [Kiritimatiellia bacterium]